MAERAGLDVVHIPVKNDTAPTVDQVVTWLTLCKQCYRNRPIFVHCKSGEGRTSAFCAALRLAQGHSVDGAISEQRQFSFEPEGAHSEQARFLYALAEQARSGAVTLPAIPL